MREITREAESAGRVELIDGVKVYEEYGWALVLPDASEPYVHVYAESPSSPAAERLLERYVARIEALRA